MRTRRLKCLLCLVVLGVTTRPLHAQDRVHESILAFLLGDYETAAHALRPIAEASGSRDSTAQFLMAMLYASGTGVKYNAAKACSLYASSAMGSTPLKQQAESLAAALRRSALGNTASCLPIVTHPWSGPPQTSIVLGPNHYVTIDNGVTISYQGADYHHSALQGAPGASYLPIQYSPLDVSSPIATRRHFLESVWWQRGTNSSGQWTLAWELHEVLGGVLIPITGHAALASVAAIPSRVPIKLPNVMVNERGEAVLMLRAAGCFRLRPYHSMRRDRMFRCRHKCRGSSLGLRMLLRRCWQPQQRPFIGETSRARLNC